MAKTAVVRRTVPHGAPEAGPTAHPFASIVESEVSHACDNSEARWAAGFSVAIESAEWCRKLQPFGREALLGREMPGSGTAVILSCAVRHKERKGRHRLAAFVSGWERNHRAVSDEERARWPGLPKGWNKDIEVPYALVVGNPTPTRIWATKMREAPFADGLWYTDPQSWARWCASFTLFAQDVCSELLRGLEHGRLYYLPRRLVEAMEGIGLELLTGSSGAGALAAKALWSISRVFWDKVDPATSIRPAVNEYSCPVFDSGDSVPWQSEAAHLVEALWLPQGIRYAVRQCRLHGDLAGLSTEQEIGVAPESFFDPAGRGGIRVELLSPGAPGGWQRHAGREVDKARNPQNHDMSQRGGAAHDLFRNDHTRWDAAPHVGVVKKRSNRRKKRKGRSGGSRAPRPESTGLPNSAPEPARIAEEGQTLLRQSVGGSRVKRETERGAAASAWSPGQPWIPGVSKLPLSFGSCEGGSLSTQSRATPVWAPGEEWIPGVSRLPIADPRLPRKAPIFQPPAVKRLPEPSLAVAGVPTLGAAAARGAHATVRASGPSVTGREALHADGRDGQPEDPSPLSASGPVALATRVVEEAPPVVELDISERARSTPLGTVTLARGLQRLAQAPLQSSRPMSAAAIHVLERRIARARQQRAGRN